MRVRSVILLKLSVNSTEANSSRGNVESTLHEYKDQRARKIEGFWVETILNKKES